MTDGGTVEPERCPLCASIAVIRWRAEERHYHVICPLCFRYTLEAYLLDLLRAERRAGDPRVLDVLRRLSRAAQRTAAAGGQLNLLGDNWLAIAHDADEPD